MNTPPPLLREYPAKGLKLFRWMYDGTDFVCHVDFEPEVDDRGEEYRPAQATVMHVFAHDSDTDLSQVIRDGIVTVLEAEALLFFKETARSSFREPLDALETV